MEKPFSNILNPMQILGVLLYQSATSMETILKHIKNIKLCGYGNTEKRI